MNKLIDRRKLCRPSYVSDFIVSHPGPDRPKEYVTVFHDPDYMANRLEVVTILN